MTLRTDLTDVTLVSEDTYWRLMILRVMMLEVMIGVLVMEVDKMAVEVADFEIDMEVD